MAKKEIQVHSKNSLIQLTQQKNKFLEFVPKVLNADTKDATVRVINAVFNPAKVGDIPINTLIEFIGKWRAMVGATKDSDPAAINIEANHLKNIYPNMNFSEVELAVHFLVTQKLPMKLPDYINFSPLFISKVIDTYNDLKEALLVPVIKMANELPAPDGSDVPMDKRVEDFKFFITECKKHMDEGGKENFFNQDVYDFLRLTKRMIFTDEIVSAAKEYGKKKYALFVSMQTLSLQSTTSKEAKTKKIRELGIEYCLMDFFSKNDIKKVLDSITVEEYENYKKVQEEKKKERAEMEAYCKLCLRMTGPLHHSGCDRHNEPTCAWNIHK